MIDPAENLILIKGKILTDQIESCAYNPYTDKYDVRFVNSPTVYHYKKDNVVWLRNPIRLDPQAYRLSHEGRQLTNIDAIWVFTHNAYTYWYIRFCNGRAIAYDSRKLQAVKSCLTDPGSKAVFGYLKEVAAENGILADDGTRLLSKQYAKIDFIPDDRAIASYLNPLRFRPQKYPAKPLIFPFGCNASQQKAVQTAFENQISVIQGPPGTGKTQTILNIIANILLFDKTVLVVSNNNSATANVLEKLSGYGLGFIVAPLGNSDNKLKFVDAQEGEKRCPEDLASWYRAEVDHPAFFDDMYRDAERLRTLFAVRERLASIRQELQALEIEWLHFHRETECDEPRFRLRRFFGSTHLLKLWQECQRFVDREHPSGWGAIARIVGRTRWFLFRLKCRIACNAGREFYRQDVSAIVSAFRILFYKTRLAELRAEIRSLEKYPAERDAKKLLSALSEKSMICLKHTLSCRYGKDPDRPVFALTELKSRWKEFLREYPVVLSTTFSARTSLHDEAEYDYLIMDEASQVSVETGVLALSCARNVIIVGDSMQLPNVVTEDDRRKLDAIVRKYDLPEGYDCAAYSFLESVCRIIPDVPQTLLREHYRCHPKIIDFCNQKFYGGELVCMTQDKGEADVLSAVRTVAGDHARNHANYREVEVIEDEVLPALSGGTGDIGIIAPYNNQIQVLKNRLGEKIDIATVHKFQGREKDVIVMTTVDNTITPFTDDPHLLNVAVSRAKQKFCLVVSGNEQPENCNIGDLIAYIAYNNGSVTQSKIHSVFDYLYKQYTEVRIAYLRKHARVSEYDSENLTYALIEDVLNGDARMRHLGVICHQPLNLLIRDFSLLDGEECRYARHGSTHLDFLIYNRVSKRPILAVETDGYAYHREGTQQWERDRMKDRILHLYGIPLVRLSTTGSREREIIENRLKDLLQIS